MRAGVHHFVTKRRRLDIVERSIFGRLPKSEFPRWMVDSTRPGSSCNGEHFVTILVPPNGLWGIRS